MAPSKPTTKKTKPRSPGAGKARRAAVPASAYVLVLGTLESGGARFRELHTYWNARTLEKKLTDFCQNTEISPAQLALAYGMEMSILTVQNGRVTQELDRPWLAPGQEVMLTKHGKPGGTVRFGSYEDEYGDDLTLPADVEVPPRSRM